MLRFLTKVTLDSFFITPFLNTDIFSVNLLI